MVVVEMVLSWLLLLVLQLPSTARGSNPWFTQLLLPVRLYTAAWLQTQ